MIRNNLLALLSLMIAILSGASVAIARIEGNILEMSVLMLSVAFFSYYFIVKITMEKKNG
jgi:hypothetical protein